MVSFLFTIHQITGCGHCKAMKGDYSLAAAELMASGTKLVTVDATVERELSSRFSIMGFPTLKYLVNGVEISEYNGARTKQAVVEFQLNPPTSPKNAKQEL